MAHIKWGGGGGGRGSRENPGVTSRVSLQDKAEEKIERNRKHLTIFRDVLNDINHKEEGTTKDWKGRKP